MTAYQNKKKGEEVASFFGYNKSDYSKASRKEKAEIKDILNRLSNLDQPSKEELDILKDLETIEYDNIFRFRANNYIELKDDPIKFKERLEKFINFSKNVLSHVDPDTPGGQQDIKDVFKSVRQYTSAIEKLENLEAYKQSKNKSEF